MSSFKFGLITALSFSSLSVLAQTPTFTYKLLKDIRSEITLPVYTSAERKTVVNQAYMVMNEIFVHRDLKFANFGSQIDPLPMLKDLETRVETISDRAFHSEMAEIFFKQNDLHTSYANPKPYACYRTLLPFSFKEVINLQGEKVIAVAYLSSIAEVKALAPDVDIKIGDTVVSVDGVPVYEAAKKWLTRTSGANPPAQFRRSISLLSFISQKNNFFPENDASEIVLKSRNGQTYIVKAPWIARGDVKCLTPEKEETAEIAVDDYQLDFNRTYRRAKNKSNKALSAEALKDTAEPILKYKIVRNEFGDFGYLTLESFMPEKLTVDAVILEVKKLLTKELAQTDGLIFDIRSNGGGYIFLAEGMVQLFTPKNPTPMNFVLKNSAANRHFLFETTGDGNPFNIVLRAAQAEGTTYTAPIPLNRAEEVDTLGQYYFKPVAILTNANCYSSCDMFSAQMQDHGSAIIFGEESTTGAGGANNRNLTDTIKALKDNLGPYQKLPSGQDIGFSYRQTIRVGKSAGILLEDRGVISDVIVPATLSDLYTDSGDQFKIISKALAEKAKDYTASVKMADTRIDVLNSEKPKIFVQWENTEKIEFRYNRVAVETIEIENSNSTGRALDLPKMDEGQYTIKKYELIGLNKNERVWRKFYSYRTVPLASDLEESLVITLENDEAKPFAIYNDGNEAKNGWVVSDKTLRIGNGVEYADSVKAEATLFLNLSADKEFVLNFEALQSSEKDFDFFKVKIIVDGKEVDLIKGLSGEEPMKAYSFDLAAYKGKKIEIRFIFESDIGVEGKGPIVKNIALVTK
jgi:C-terminal processing protease CtpA/Prc